MIDIRQTLEYANYLSDLGWVVERIRGVNYFIKKFPVIGSVIKIQRPEQIDHLTIQHLAIKYRSWRIIIEPKNDSQQQTVVSHQFRPSKSAYLPTKTLQLDLIKSEKELLRGMKKDARYILRKLKNYRTEEPKNLRKFRDSWKKAVGWKHYVPPLNHLVALKKSFKKDSLFLLANDDSSGAIFLTGSKTAYYWQAFTDKEGRKLGAQYKIVWEGIRWAKARKAKVFDFEGIYDERFPNKNWLGFTHFKKSFGGHEGEYPGAFVKNLLPFGL